MIRKFKTSKLTDPLLGTDQVNQSYSKNCILVVDGGSKARVVVSEVESNRRRDYCVVNAIEDVHVGRAEVVDRVDEAVARPLTRDADQRADVHAENVAHAAEIGVNLAALCAVVRPAGDYADATEHGRV